MDEYSHVYFYWYDREIEIPVGPYPSRRFTRGDRVRIKEGYERAGEVGHFDGKSVNRPDAVCIVFDAGDWDKHYLLADAIEPYPYTREERIERAIEDYYNIACNLGGDKADKQALLFAILDAGV